MINTVTVKSADQTMAIGQKLAQYLKPQDLILLDGDLGAGKTTFTKGLAKGLGIDRPIKSPTFTIIREYQDGRIPLYHMDVYRLEEGGADDLGLEEYFNGDGSMWLSGRNLWPMNYQISICGLFSGEMIQKVITFER